MAEIGAPNTPEKHTSDEATIDSVSPAGAGEAPAADYKNSLDYAAVLTEEGAAALQQSHFEEAIERYGRAMKICVSHYGELSPDCFHAYYHYGRALLCKAQVEKSKQYFEQYSNKDEFVKNATNGESTASLSSNADADGKSESKFQEEAADIDHEAGDDENLAEADEDESDLDLAWKWLDVAREIAEKNPTDTLEKVNVLLALADVSLEQGDIETSLSHYLKALPILERIVEPYNRLVALINFRICICLEIGFKLEEAIPYCQRALSICNSRIQRLKNEVKTSSESSNPSGVSDLEAEIGILTGLSGDLERKLEYLQTCVVNMNPIPTEVLGTTAGKANDGEKSPSAGEMESSQMGTSSSHLGFDSLTLSTGHTNGAAVTHLGVVGRGVKRVLLDSETPESSLLKKPSLDPEDRGYSN